MAGTATAGDGYIHTITLTQGTLWVQPLGRWLVRYYEWIIEIWMTPLEVLFIYDVRLPLMRRTPVTFPEVGEKMIEFRYEYLPEYCFACGRINWSCYKRKCEEI
ncbi:unnamed protein product [Prunus armeniaca]